MPAEPEPERAAVAPIARSGLNTGMYQHLQSSTPTADGTPRPRGVKRKREGTLSGKSSGGGMQGKPNTLGEPTPRPETRYSDMGGIQHILDDIRDLIEYPLTHPELYEFMHVKPPVGVLLHGPAGCGKTTLAHAIAGELGVHFRSVSAPEVVSGMSGESEEKIRQLFADAAEHAPALLFIDELDAIAPKREDSSRGMEKRIVAQLLSSLDQLATTRNPSGNVVVIAATARPDSLDSNLRRAGRFDREVCLGIPDEEARRAILSTCMGSMRLGPEVSIAAIARRTPGYVGADLTSLAKEAAIAAVNRAFASLFPEAGVSAHPDAAAAPAAGAGDNPSLPAASASLSAPAAPARFPWRDTPPLQHAQLAGLSISQGDIDSALKSVQPSAIREGFTTVPDVSWEDIGALHDVREELHMCVVKPISAPEQFAQLGLSAPAGVLLYGPPGCGKTLLAKAVAHASHANFISIKGPELLDKYVGESERAVRQVFTRARASAPCVVFFDELDALAPRRGGGSEGGSGVSERVVNQLLTELDGMGGRRSVFVIGATNRPDMIDSAMLRPGRLDKLLYVPLPAPAQRVDILAKAARHTPLAADVDLTAVALSESCNGFSGADLAALVREASLQCLRQSFGEAAVEGPMTVSAAHFEAALNKSRPSVSPAERRMFENLARSLSNNAGKKAQVTEGQK